MAIVYGDFMYYVKLKQPIVDREELEHLYSELRCVGVTAFVQIFHQVEYKLIDCLHDGSRTDLGSFHNSESDERSCKFVMVIRPTSLQQYVVFQRIYHLWESMEQCSVTL